MTIIARNNRVLGYLNIIWHFNRNCRYLRFCPHIRIAGISNRTLVTFARPISAMPSAHTCYPECSCRFCLWRSFAHPRVGERVSSSDESLEKETPYPVAIPHSTGQGRRPLGWLTQHTPHETTCHTGPSTGRRPGDGSSNTHNIQLS